MSCSIKEGLLKSYRDFTAGYVRAIKRMKTINSASSHSDFSSLRELAKDCQRKSEEAKRSLQRHISEHHC